MFKQWYRLAKPNKKYWILQFISVTIPSICLVFESFYLAKVTTCVSASNWDYAIANLIIAFAILVIRGFCWDFNYRNTFKLTGCSYLRIQKELYDKIIGSSDTNLNNNSKEKLINIMHEAVYNTSKFSDVICSKYRFLISAIICIGYIMFANLYIGLIMVAVFILNIVILRKINDKIASTVKHSKICIDREYEAFSDAIESKNIVEELGIKEKVRNKTLDVSYDYIKSQYKYNVAWSYLDNYFFMFYRFIRFALTIALIFLLKGDLITLTAYFVMVSYLADTLSYNNDFCKLFTELKNVNVAVNRINIILDFDDRKTIYLGNIDKNNISGEIDFVDVYYKAENDEFKLNNIYDVSFHINNNECVLFKGERGSGKRTIFYLLRRLVEVNSGEIYVGRTTLREYSKNSQIENINYIATKPYFFKDTIKANLKLVNNNDAEIEQACKLVNVYDSIINLPNGFDSPIDILTQRDKYLLSVARTLLMHCTIVIFYEFPSYLNAQDEETVKNVIDIIRLNHTVIIFSATNKCTSIADKVYNVSDGKISLLQDNTNSNRANNVFDALEDYDNTAMFSQFNKKKKGLTNLLKRYAKENIGNKK
jgi:ABC-type multidrug transport system fused ATPase/permease subunit